MKKLPIVALIGQTNAGKSSILNRLARKNIAIVAREEGTTRDNVMTKIDDAFVLIDTAGLKDPSDEFEASIQDQILDAIESADIILVTLDSSKYFDHRDAKIAKDALRSGKPVYLVLNKCDLGESLPLTEFRALGIAPEKTFYVSATTGEGIATLKGSLMTHFGPRPAGPSPRAAGANARAAALRNATSPKYYAILFFLFAVTLFLTFSRGAIYAFIVAMIFMTAIVFSRSKCFTRDTQRSATPSANKGARPSLWSRVKHLRVTGILWLITILAFLFTLNLQGVLAQIGPTNDTYQSGVAKALNHLSLGIIDIRQQKNEEDVNDDAGEINEGEEMDSVFDGYVEESTEIRKMMTRYALRVWSQDVRTMAFGVGIGGAGQAMFDAGLIDSPKEIVQNEYASLLLEVGIVGVVLLVLAAVLIVKSVIKAPAAPMVLTLMVAYGVTLVFFSGFANALQIYLLPIVLYIIEDNGQAMVLRKKLVS